MICTSIKFEAARLAAPTSKTAAAGAADFGLEAEGAAEVAEDAGEAWAFPSLPTPEEPEGLVKFLPVEFEFEFEKKEELDK